MATVLADVPLARLPEWGVPRVYWSPGSGIPGLPAARERAAVDAVGFAQRSGRSGYSSRPANRGAVHLLNDLYVAKLESPAVVGIVGRNARMAISGSYARGVGPLSLVGPGPPPRDTDPDFGTRPNHRLEDHHELL